MIFGVFDLKLGFQQSNSGLAWCVLLLKVIFHLGGQNSVDTKVQRSKLVTNFDHCDVSKSTDHTKPLSLCLLPQY